MSLIEEVQVIAKVTTHIHQQGSTFVAVHDATSIVHIDPWCALCPVRCKEDAEHFGFLLVGRKVVVLKERMSMIFLELLKTTISSILWRTVVLILQVRWQIQVQLTADLEAELVVSSSIVLSNTVRLTDSSCLQGKLVCIEPW